MRPGGLFSRVLPGVCVTVSVELERPTQIIAKPGLELRSLDAEFFPSTSQ